MNNIILVGQSEYKELIGKMDALLEITQEKVKIVDNDYITTTDFAKKFGISKVTQWKLRKAGRIPYRMIGKSILYRLSEIDQFSKQ